MPAMQRKDIPTRSVLIACHRFHVKKSGEAPWRYLMRQHGAPEKVVYAAMDRDFDRGLLNYGVSLGTSWVTDKGLEFLEGSNASQ